MEFQDEIKRNIRAYVSKEMGIAENDINYFIDIEPMDGMSNKNFHLTIKKETKNPSKPKIIHLLYRIFGGISACLTHDLEHQIMDELAKTEEGPKIFLANDSFRLCEYLINTSQIGLEMRYNPDIMMKIYPCLANYSRLTNIFHYEINENDKLISVVPATDYSENKVELNIFTLALEKMLPQARKSFAIFEEKFKNEFSPNNILYKEQYEYFNKFKYYLENYEKIFISLLPKSGYFILGHNDCHRWNFLIDNIKDKLYIIDHEYASLDLIGLDICNYMNENSFYFNEEGYHFKEDEIDLDFYYANYLEYIEYFERRQMDWIASSDDAKKYIEYIKERNYYINLHSITNLFNFLYCSIYINFENEFAEDNNANLLHYGYDRLRYAEKMNFLINNNK